MRMSRCIRSRSEGGARARGMAMVKRAKDTGGKTAGATNWFIDKVWLDAKDTGGIDRRRYQLENGETPEVAFRRRWTGQEAGPTKPRVGHGYRLPAKSQ